MARKSKGDKIVETLIENVREQIRLIVLDTTKKETNIESNNDMIHILKQQLKTIEDICEKS